MGGLRVETVGENDTGTCACCGDASRVVWGFVHDDDAGTPVAAYYVHWTPGKVEGHGASFDLVLGEWGEGTSSADRELIAVELRVTEEGPAFGVVDAAGRPSDDPELVGRALARDDVIGTELAAEAFAILDAIWLDDARIADVTGIR